MYYNYLEKHNMNILISDQPALILINLQKAFDDNAAWGNERNNPTAEDKASELLEIWRKHQLPVFHVKHCSLNTDSLFHESNKGNDFKDEVKPISGEVIIKKKVHSAFIETNLQEQLERKKITKLVIVGMTTDSCVSTTARMAGNYGFDTYVVSDATATFNKKGLDGENFPADLVQGITMAGLQDEFATILTTEGLKSILESN